MDYCYERDFMFCSICGTRLTFTSLDAANCPLCGFRRNAQELVTREIKYVITAEDIRRELKLEPFVGYESVIAEEGTKRAVVSEPCPKCQHPQLEYETRQLRSADEGQTVFYTCPKCGYKFKQDT